MSLVMVERLLLMIFGRKLLVMVWCVVFIEKWLWLLVVLNIMFCFFVWWILVKIVFLLVRMVLFLLWNVWVIILLWCSKEISFFMGMMGWVECIVMGYFKLLVIWRDLVSGFKLYLVMFLVWILSFNFWRMLWYWWNSVWILFLLILLGL